MNGEPWYHNCCWWWGFLSCVVVPGMLFLGISIGKGINPRNPQQKGVRVAWVGEDGVRRVGMHLGEGQIRLDDGSMVYAADGVPLIPLDEDPSRVPLQ